SKTLEDSLKMTEMGWGAEHTEMANALTEIGEFHRQVRHHAEAQTCFHRALAIYRKGEEFDSTQACEGLHHLALSLEESGDIEGAAQEYERFLSLSERQIGGKRDRIAQAQVRLAELHLRADRSSMARELLVQAIHTLESVRGNGLQDVLELMAVAEEESGR